MKINLWVWFVSPADLGRPLPTFISQTWISTIITQGWKIILKPPSYFWVTEALSFFQSNLVFQWNIPSFYKDTSQFFSLYNYIKSGLYSCPFTQSSLMSVRDGAPFGEVKSRRKDWHFSPASVLKTGWIKVITTVWEDLLVCGWLRFTCQRQTTSLHHKGWCKCVRTVSAPWHGWRSGEGPWDRAWCCHGTGWAFLSTAWRAMGLMGKVINPSKAGVICSLPLQVDWLRKKKKQKHWEFCIATSCRVESESMVLQAAVFQEMLKIAGLKSQFNSFSIL